MHALVICVDSCMIECNACKGIKFMGNKFWGACVRIACESHPDLGCIGTRPSGGCPPS